MKNKQKYYLPYKDMFNIYNLIKKINPGYRLFFNKLLKRFEIVNINKNFEICYIFDTFFRNIIKELQFSRIENINKIIKNLDIENETLENKNIEKTIDITKQKLNDVVDFSKRSNTITKKQINKIIGA